MKLKFAGLLILMALPVITGCSETQGNTAATPPVEVGYVTLQREPVIIQQELAGRVKASLQADVRPQVDGIIRQRLFNEGEYIEAGQVLYKLNDESYRASYNQTVAALRSAEATLESARLRNERYANLVAINGISAQEADDALSAYTQALATVEERRAARDIASINLSRTEIKAPISGYIGISNFTEGALVTANQADALAVIRALDTVYVDMTQNAADVQRLQRLLASNIIESGSAEVSLLFDNGRMYAHKGKLQLKEISVNESTGAVTLRAEFPNPDGILMPGMYVRAVLDEAVDNNGILAPQQGIGWDVKGNATAMVLSAENVVETRDLRLGFTSGDKWLVLDGLNAGDRIIIEGRNKIRNGDTVVPNDLSTQAVLAEPTPQAL